MFADLGTRTDPSWRARAEETLSGRLWGDIGIFVVDAAELVGAAPASDLPAAEPAPALAACAVGVLHRSLPSPRRATETVGYVEWVVTDPARRRQGHASTATAALVDWLTDQGAAVIDVHASAAAEPLYRRLGFTDGGPVALRVPTRHRLI